MSACVVNHSTLTTIEDGPNLKILNYLCVHQTEISGDCWGVKLSESCPAEGLKRGDVILETDPIVAAVYGEAMNLPGAKTVIKPVCSYCCCSADSERSLNLCSQCKIAFFCSRACQRAAWALYHKNECFYWRERCQNILIRNKIRKSFTVRLLVILLTYLDGLKYELRNLSDVDKPNKNLLAQGVYSLESLCCGDPLHPSSLIVRCLELLHPRDLPENVASSTLESNQSIIQLVEGIMLSGKTSFNDGATFSTAIEHLLYKILQNSVSILNSGLSSVGVGLYPLMTFFNHSCVPNCVVIFKGVRLFIACLRDIRPGEQLTIGYTSPANPFSERQGLLMKQYNFMCQCPLCNEASPFSKAYNRLCEEEICPTCFASWTSDYPYLGSYDWFKQHVLDKPDYLQINNLVKQFLEHPFTLKETCHGMSCRRCGGTFPGFQPNFQALQQDSSLTLEKVDFFFKNFLRHIDRDYDNSFLKNLREYPSMESYKLLSCVARVKKYRDYISFLADSSLSLKSSSPAKLRHLVELQLMLLTLDVIMNKLALGVSDSVANLLQVRLGHYLRNAGYIEKANAVFQDTLEQQPLSLDSLKKKIITNIGCFSGILPIFQLGCFAKHVEESHYFSHKYAFEFIDLDGLVINKLICEKELHK